MDETRVMTPLKLSEEEGRSLRPRQLSDYIGQEKVREKLKLFLDASKIRGDALDHLLLAGPPGLGKTTLAHIVANELCSQLHVVAGPNIERKGDLAAILSNLNEKDVLFIDEIHRIAKPVEEVLYGAMEDFKLDIIVGQGPAARTLRIDLPAFTLVGATTRSGLLSSPLRDRFGIQLHLDFYPPEELQAIIEQSARLLKLSLDASGASEIGKRSRGTPRIANRLLRRVRDFAQVQKVSQVDRHCAQSALELFEIDVLGLDPMDRKLLLAVIEKFDGGPVGIENLSSVLGEERDTLEEIYEPFLLQQALLQRTPRGRVATRKAYEHFNLPWQNPSEQLSLT